MRVRAILAATIAATMLAFCGTAPVAAATTDAVNLCKTASAVMHRFHAGFANDAALSTAFAAMEQSDLYEHPVVFVEFVLLTTPKIWLLRNTDYAKIQPVLYKQCLQHMQQTTT